jgi:NAD(P)-dependent dehydrogenase (short-subunit alcohol dehydrogenase family)
MPVAIVTGAGGNLGRVTVAHFLSHHWTVVATVSPGKKWPDAPHPNLHTYAIDLTDSTAVQHWVEAVSKEFKQIHAGLLLAGGFAPAKIDHANGASLRHMLEINALTAWNVVQPLVLHMLQHQQGRIVFIGARPALHIADAGFALPYAFSKSLLLRYNEAINHLCDNKNVKSCVLVPDIIDTPANRKAMPNADFTRWVKPDQMAEAMLAFASSRLEAPENLIKFY